jgi:predicted DNA-binding transcriptional regulator AlpA
METQTQQIADLVCAVQTLISRMDGPANRDLWDAGDIAEYVRLSKKTVQSHLVEKPGFPRAIILATGGRRWVSSEVKAWVLRRRS